MRGKIKGGYVLQPRQLDSSGIMESAPVVRELWAYICRNVNWKENPREGIARGEGFFRFKEIQEDLCWWVGFRKKVYSKPQITKSLRRLREGNAIATTKETRGIRVKVLKYSYYQDPKNYEGNDEEPTKETRRKRKGSTTLEKGKERKEGEYRNPNPSSNSAEKRESTWGVKTRLDAVNDRLDQLRSKSPGPHCDLCDFLNDEEKAEWAQLSAKRKELIKQLIS